MIVGSSGKNPLRLALLSGLTKHHMLGSLSFPHCGLLTSGSLSLLGQVWAPVSSGTLYLAGWVALSTHPTHREGLGNAEATMLLAPWRALT
jgi:hypothetical protein